ncbi:cytochrome c oxidase assembly protein [Polycladidibacter hongkongensis]|uniref:cytochrome c oxidase assembly protein n=1 Tax=Polycladidibacter hongkongensis TaxID=1647556 RepID=UPI0008295300|nr:cytochrome c oxidase assembly protein [Pseudovibrio hongkongensis]
MQQPDQHPHDSVAQRALSKRNQRVAVLCLSLFAGMIGLSFAAVPLYQLFCQVTGYGGTTQRVEEATNGIEVLDRTITVRFDANTAGGLPWDFAPKQRTIKVRLGQMAEVFYTAQNDAGRRTAGTSTFNVFPYEMGGYFNKIDCFCFTEQPLAAGESVDMPILFFIDPEMDKDPDLKFVKEVTLSYTFFPSQEEETKTSALSLQGEQRDAKL